MRPGNNMSMMKTLAASLALGCCAFAGAAMAGPAGEITLLTGRGTSTSVDGAIRTLAKGDPVYSGEVISSSVNSYLNIKFADGGFVLLRPNSRFEIENFAYVSPEETAKKPVQTPAPIINPAGPAASSRPMAPPAPAAAQANTASAFFRLLKGGFRAVSGLVGHVDRNEYRVSTPVATIGIRGTDYELILCDAPCAADPVIAGSLPLGAIAEGGAVVGVITGGVLVTNAAGKAAELGENQYLVNLPDGTQIRLPFEPRFLRVDPIPNPAKVCE
jgi:hypothetical protein